MPRKLTKLPDLSDVLATPAVRAAQDNHNKLAARLQAATVRRDELQAQRALAREMAATVSAAERLVNDPGFDIDSFAVVDDEFSKLQREITTLTDAINRSSQRIYSERQRVAADVAASLKPQVMSAEAADLADALIAAGEAAERYMAVILKLGRAGADVSWPQPQFIGSLMGQSPVGRFLSDLRGAGVQLPDDVVKRLQSGADWFWPIA